MSSSKVTGSRITGSIVRLVALALVLALASACRQDMHDQPKYEPLEPSAFFADARASRPPVEGTVPRGFLREDPFFFTGKTTGATPGANTVPATPGQPGGNQTGAIQTSAAQTGGASQAGGTGAPPAGQANLQQSYQGFATTFPFPVTKEVMDRGEERYNIFCSVCHSRTGDGLGMVVRRGYRRPPSLHDDRLRQAPPGYLFDVITNGFGAMPDYAAQITPRDRWAIVAYIRALQLSQQGTLADVPPEERDKLNSGSQRQEGRQQ
ncbi:MAG TPA: cytochrome c [Blastocatellia bacterium]|nr:cytochrome c [Blastocatellia bacterium]